MKYYNNTVKAFTETNNCVYRKEALQNMTIATKHAELGKFEIILVFIYINLNILSQKLNRLKELWAGAPLEAENKHALCYQPLLSVWACGLKISNTSQTC